MGKTPGGTPGKHRDSDIFRRGNSPENLDGETLDAGDSHHRLSSAAQLGLYKLNLYGIQSTQIEPILNL